MSVAKKTRTSRDSAPALRTEVKEGKTPILRAIAAFRAGPRIVAAPCRATLASTSCSSPSRSGRRRFATASTRCPTAPASGSRSRGRRPRTGRSRPRAGGRRCAPSTAPSRPTPTRRPTSRPACGTTTTCATCGSCATRRTPTARWPASSSRTPAPTARTARRGCRRRRRRRSRATSPGITPKTMEQLDIDRIISDWVRAADPLARRRLRHRLRLRRPLLPARADALAVLQPAHRRVRRLAREPGADVDRDARGGARGGRLGLRDRLPDGGRRRRAAPGWSSTRGSSSCAWPTTWSTSGTCTSARSRSGRRTRAHRASSPRAGSSNGPGTCAGRPGSRSSASAA